MTYVLIAEDDPAIADALAQTIDERLGLPTRHVMNGALVIDALDARRPDLLILDVSLPGLSGVDVFALVRSDERWRGLPILFLTAFPEKVAGAAATGGVHEVIGKPFDIDDLTRRVTRLLEIGARTAAA